MQSDTTIPYGYCQCGCGQQTPLCERSRYPQGWVKGEPKPFLPHHKPPRLSVDYIIDETTGCWNWQGHIRSDGYAYGARQGKRWLMHRYYYEQLHGPIAPEKELDHLCRNRRCVNPSHLEPVLRVINIQRGAKTKLTAEQVRAIREMQGTYTARDVSRMYGVSPELIYQIWLRHTWKNL